MNIIEREKRLMNDLDLSGRIAADVLDGANFKERLHHVSGVPLLLCH